MVTIYASDFECGEGNARGYAEWVASLGVPCVVEVVDRATEATNHSDLGDALWIAYCEDDSSAALRLFARPDDIARANGCDLVPAANVRDVREELREHGFAKLAREALS